MTKPGPAFFQEPMASQLVHLRIKARRKLNALRKKKRLTYDCLNAVVKHDSVVCRKRHKFKTQGKRKKPGLSLLSVLRGMSSSVCQTCKHYDGETTE